MSTGIGEALRAARRQQGRSLADAASATRVRESYLAALEEEEFAALGGDVYVRGFLRSYARFLGLNPEPLLESFRREHERPDEAPPLAPTGRPMDLDGRRGLSPLALLATALLAVLALYVVFNRSDSDPASVPVPPPVDSGVNDSGGSGSADDAGQDPDATADDAVPGDALDPNAPAEEET